MVICFKRTGIGSQGAEREIERERVGGGGHLFHVFPTRGPRGGGT